MHWADKVNGKGSGLHLRVLLFFKSESQHWEVLHRETFEFGSWAGMEGKDTHSIFENWRK